MACTFYDEATNGLKMVFVGLALGAIAWFVAGSGAKESYEKRKRAREAERAEAEKEKRKEQAEERRAEEKQRREIEKEKRKAEAEERRESRTEARTAPGPSSRRPQDFSAIFRSAWEGRR